MPGRHQAASRRRVRLRWLVGIAGGALVGATLLSFASAGAATEPVKATFGVTGVATDGCPVSIGGTDVYVKPGQDLQVQSSLLGLYVLEGLLGTAKVDLNDVIGQIASLGGALKIDPGTSRETDLKITNTVQTVSGLASGDHGWTWTVDTVKLLNLVSLPLHIDTGVVGAGAKLSWSGTIHVTSAVTKCGIAVQLPSASASVSVTGLPPIQIGVPGVKVSVPVTIPSLPGLGGKKTTAPAGGHTSTAAEINNPIPVPARVVPGNGVPAGGGGNVVPVTNLGSSDQGGGSLVGASHTASSGTAAPDQNSTGKHKTIDLAASPSSSTGEVWVVLAIVAVIALAFVAATYARLYLLKRRN